MLIGPISGTINGIFLSLIPNAAATSVAQTLLCTIGVGTMVSIIVWVREYGDRGRTPSLGEIGEYLQWRWQTIRNAFT